MDPEAVALIKGCQLTRLFAMSFLVKMELSSTLSASSSPSLVLHRLTSSCTYGEQLLHNTTDTKKRKVSGMNGSHHCYSWPQGCNRYSLSSSCVICSKCPSPSVITSAGVAGFSSVQFSHSVVSDSLQPHESQHARPPCSSPTPGVHSDSRPSSQ